MRAPSIRRAFALVAVVTVGSLTAACTPSSGVATAPTATYTFTANSVTVNESNDVGPCLFGICVPPANDEPYVINVGFSVKTGVANSATSQVVVGDNQWSGIFDQGPGEGETDTFELGQQAAVTFSKVPMLDVNDLLLTSNHLEVVGVWTWAMEADLLGVSGLATAAGNAIAAALNATLAASSAPTDANALIGLVINAITGNLFSTLGGLLASVVPFAGDDAIGSRMYIGIGARGTLASLFNAALGGVSFPSLAIPVLNTPPDIDGGAIVTLGNKAFTNQVMTNAGVDGKHTYNLGFAKA